MLAVGITVLLCTAFLSACGAEFELDTRFVQLPWSTDSGACVQEVGDDSNDNCGQLGPDGPWQAPLLWMLGQSNQPRLALYPHNDQWTSVLSKDQGGIYDAEPQQDDITYTRPLTNESFTGGLYNDTTLVGRTPKNITLNMATSWNITMANDKTYTRKNGLLGLMHPDIGQGNLLRQLRTANETASAGWSLHMGSASLGQAGSLILGGFDATRIAGAVGQFKLHDPLKPPDIKLASISLGQEAGGSPFGFRAEITNATVWEPPRPQSTIPIQVSARDPGMYLPKGACKAIIENLPATWQNDIGYYTWNTTDSRYKTLVSSPGYIGFTFVDQRDLKFTIKVMFALLDLKLKSPIVKEPTPYFPCHEIETTSTAVYSLGRAFLQGAYLAYNYDRNLTYLGQAVGPTMPAPTLYAFPPPDDGYGTDGMSVPDATFYGSWANDLNVIPLPDDYYPEVKQHLSKRIIAGIAVGSVVVVAMVAGCLLMLWRRRRRLRAAASDDDDMTIGVTRRKRGELEGDYPALEMDGKGAKQELEAPNTVHEVIGSDVTPVFELEGEFWKESPVIIEEKQEQESTQQEPTQEQEPAQEQEREEEQEPTQARKEEPQEVSPLESKEGNIQDEGEECSPMEKDDAYAPDVKK